MFKKFKDSSNCAPTGKFIEISLAALNNIKTELQRKQKYICSKSIWFNFYFETFVHKIGIRVVKNIKLWEFLYNIKRNTVMYLKKFTTLPKTDNSKVDKKIFCPILILGQGGKTYFPCYTKLIVSNSWDTEYPIYLDK